MTNFFSQIAAIDFKGNLNLTLKKDGDSLTVSVLLQNDACGDNAKNHIPPLILKGSPKELGEGFFPAIAEPVQTTSQLLVNMEQFRKGQEAAKKNAASEQKKTGTQTKPTAENTDPKEKKYLTAMGQVDALEAEGKFREAWVKVPQPTDYPDKAEALRSRRAALSAKFSPDLFGAEPAATIVEPNTDDDATDQDDAEGIPYEGEGE